MRCSPAIQSNNLIRDATFFELRTGSKWLVPRRNEFLENAQLSEIRFIRVGDLTAARRLHLIRCDGQEKAAQLTEMDGLNMSTANTLALRPRTIVPHWLAAIAKRVASGFSKLYHLFAGPAKPLSSRERRQLRKAKIREVMKK